MILDITVPMVMEAEEKAPEEEMPTAEKERLFAELCEWIDCGALDPQNEVLI